MNIEHAISFIVPCFNEEENVQLTANTIREAMGNGTFEIIFIDDCSRDLTFERMQLIAADDPRIRVIRNDVNMSLGGSYKRGVAAARHDYAIMVPGDNAFPAASIRQIIDNAGRADIVIPEVVNSAVRTPFRTHCLEGLYASFELALLAGRLLLQRRRVAPNGASAHR